jgi:hypothetical protein
LTEISPQAFGELTAGGSPEVSGGEYHSLDKAWVDIHESLRKAGPPLDKALIGDRLHPDCPQTFEEFFRGGHDYYVGIASPELVREVADALGGCNPLQGTRQEGSAGFDYNIDYVGYYFRELRDVYRSAAARRNALMIVIA